MRAIRLTTVIVCLALGAGCQSTPQRVEGEAGLIGADGDSGMVLHSETLGVDTIAAYGGTKTPEGIRLGSSLTDVRRAYPGFTFFLDTSRGYPTVPGNSKAVYRINIGNGVVNELTLQFRNQNCYE